LTPKNPSIILVRPQLPENIGMVARVMHNFGLKDLIVVSPRNNWLNNKSINAAKKAFITWSQVDKKHKISLLENLLKIYKSRWDEITQTMSEEMGAPLDWSSSAQTSSGADHINDFILRLKNFEFEI